MPLNKNRNMDITFQLSSAQEITEEFIEKLKSFYKGVPISIMMKEDFQIPEWQRKKCLEDSNISKTIRSL